MYTTGLSVVVVCHYRTIHAFRILLEEIPQEETTALLKETMPNCCVWWYSRRDLDGSKVHWQISSVRRIAVQADGSAEVLSMPVTRASFGVDRRDPCPAQPRPSRAESACRRC